MKKALFALLLLVSAFTAKTQILSSPYLGEIRNQSHYYRIRDTYTSKNGSRAWICGDFGRIEYSTDSGQHWLSSDTVPVSVYLQTIYFLPDNKTGWAAGNDGTVLQSSDGGLHWVETDYDFTDDNIVDIWFSDNQDYGIAITSSTIYQTYDRGNTWHSDDTTAGVHLLIQFTSGKTGYIMNADGLLYTANAGHKWDDILSNNDWDNNFKNVPASFAATSKRLFIGDEGGLIMVSDNKGKNWRAIKSLGPHKINCFSFLDDERGWAAGNGGTLYRTLDGGNTWQQVLLKPETIAKGDIQYVHFVQDSVGSMILDTRRRLFSRDGATWIGDSLPLFQIVRLLLGDHQLLALNSRGIMHIDSASLRYTFLPVLSADQSFTDGLSDPKTGNVWAVCHSADLYTSIDGGKTFISRHIAPVNTRFNALLFSRGNKIGWLAGDSGVVYRSLDSGQSWQPLPCPTTKNIHAMSADFIRDRIFFAGDKATLLAYTNNSWQKTLFKDSNYNFIKLVFDSTFRIGFVIGYPKKEHGLIGGPQGVVYRTLDGGTTWVRLPDYPRRFTYRNLSFEKNRVWLMTSDGNILESLDNGDHWELNNTQVYYDSLCAIMEFESSVYMGGSHGFLVRAEKKNTNIIIRDFDLSTSGDSLLPNIRLNRLVGDSSSYNVEIRVWDANGEIRELEKIFELDDMSQTFWPEYAFRKNEEYQFLITISDGLNLATYRKKIFVGQTLLFTIRNAMGWDHWPKNPTEITALTTKNLALLAFLYAAIILLLYCFFPVSFFKWHEAVNAARLPFPEKLSKWLVLNLISSDHIVDAFVSRYLETALSQLRKEDEINKRFKWLPAPFSINHSKVTVFEDKAPGYTPGLTEIRKETDGLERLFVLIEGPGGLGKSTLGIQLLQWAAGSEAPNKTLRPYRMLPFFINHVDKNLDEICREKLQYLTNRSSISDGLFSALMEKQRIILLVDGLSEITDSKDEYIDPEKGSKMLHTLIVTSRRSVQNTNLTTILPAGLNMEYLDYLLDSFTAYYAEAGKFGAQREIVRIRLQKIIREAAADDKFVPLIILRRIVILAAGIIDSGKELDKELPNSVYTLYREYINEILSKTADPATTAKKLRRAAMVTLGILEPYLPATQILALKTIKYSYPQWISDNIFQICNSNDMLPYFLDSGVMVKSGDPGFEKYKFMYDSLAEYLAAAELIFAYRDALYDSKMLDNIFKRIRQENPGFCLVLSEVAHYEDVDLSAIVPVGNQ